MSGLCGLGGLEDSESASSFTEGDADGDAASEKSTPPLTTATSPRKQSNRHRTVLFLFGETLAGEHNEAAGSRSASPASRTVSPSRQLSPDRSLPWDAIKEGDIASVQVLTDQELSVRNIQQDTVYHLAAAKGQTAILEHLLGRKELATQLIDSRNHYHETPFHRACSCGQIDAARLLIQHGADVNAANQYNETPFYVACYVGNVALVNLLLSCPGIRWKESGEDNARPLTLALTRGHHAVVKAIQEFESRATSPPKQ